jgi:anti-sigma factor RsiW
MTLRRGEHPDDLISAAVSGDLTDDEHARLDAHLATCESCRETLAAWTEQRRLVANLRQPSPPRDLGPRVRAGIESGAFSVPWWRRTGLLVGVGATLATAAAAVVAVAVIGNLLPGPQVASTGSPSATASVVGSTEPSPSESAADTPQPSPTGPPIVADAIPPFYLAYAGPSGTPALTIRNGDQGATVQELPAPQGQPIRAALSPDGRWIAYITPVGLKGTNEYWVANTENGSHTDLGESSAGGSPFTYGLFWSPDSRYLSYALADSTASGTDVWAFDTSSGAVARLTSRGNVVAAGWRSTQDGESRAWITVAEADPISYELPDLATVPAPYDLAGLVSARGVFQPVWSGDGSTAIFWRGTVNASAQSGYEFVQGGAPYLARNVGRFPSRAFDAATLVFADVTIGREAFSSAAITWEAGAGDGYAVWDARWTGPPQSGDGSPYPDENRIYFSHASDQRNILAGHALDAGDVPDGAYVASVAIAPVDTDYLAVTVAFPAPGDLAVAEARTLLIKRNTGDVADELVRTFKGDEPGWYGPAVYPN